jgi:hypothetical protein
MAKIVITMAGLFALSFVLSVVAILTAAWLFYQPMPSHERNAVEQPQAVEPAKEPLAPQPEKHRAILQQ